MRHRWRPVPDEDGMSACAVCGVIRDTLQRGWGCTRYTYRIPTGDGRVAPSGRPGPCPPLMPTYRITPAPLYRCAGGHVGVRSFRGLHAYCRVCGSTVLRRVEATT